MMIYHSATTELKQRLQLGEDCFVMTGNEDRDIVFYFNTVSKSKES